MTDFLYILAFAGGLVAIIFAANWLVDGASALARKLGISDIVIGLTIVAFGTSAPELTVNIFSAIKGNTDIAIGNILGSNIINIFLILGISAIIFPLKVQSNTKWKEIPFSLLAALVLAILVNSGLINGVFGAEGLSRSGGLILLAFFAVFMVYTFSIARNNKPEVSVNETVVQGLSKEKMIPVWKSLLLVFIGLAGLFLGGKFMVEGAVHLAEMIGLSQKVIGVTIVAIGTSLPELATSVVAALKKKADIAIGNVVGSNIFNVFFILGTTAVIRPLPFAPGMNFDVFVMMLASFILFLSTVVVGTNKITRSEGIVFVILYISYLIYCLL